MIAQREKLVWKKKEKRRKKRLIKPRACKPRSKICPSDRCLVHRSMLTSSVQGQACSIKCSGPSVKRQAPGVSLAGFHFVHFTSHTFFALLPFLSLARAYIYMSTRGHNCHIHCRDEKKNEWNNCCKESGSRLPSWGPRAATLPFPCSTSPLRSPGANPLPSPRGPFPPLGAVPNARARPPARSLPLSPFCSLLCALARRSLLRSRHRFGECSVKTLAALRNASRGMATRRDVNRFTPEEARRGPARRRGAGPRGQGKRARLNGRGGGARWVRGAQEAGENLGQPRPPRAPSVAPPGADPCPLFSFLARAL